MKLCCSLAWWLAALQCLCAGVPLQQRDRAPARSRAVLPGLGRRERHILTEHLDKVWTGPAQRRTRHLRPRSRVGRCRRQQQQGQTPRNLAHGRGAPRPCQARKTNYQRRTAIEAGKPMEGSTGLDDCGRTALRTC